MKQRLDQALIQQGHAASRRQAQAMIMAGQVSVDGQPRTKPGWRVSTDEDIRVRQLPRYVSRAAGKLASTAQKIGLSFQGKTILDVGASTGGFTDYALQHGARHVYAVDTGTYQLHQKLREDPRVTVMEKTDVRDVQELPQRADLALVDVSFISLRLVLPAVKPLVNADGRIVAMAKPQFEAGQESASKHKGVIKNDRLRRQILKELEQWIKQYFVIIDKADSAVKGAKGNVERFYLLKNMK